MMKKQRGFSLVEALIAFLVVGVGIVALVKLEGLYLQSSSSSKARTVALSLAQEKLDDLKAFTQLNTTANQFAYTDIAGSVSFNSSTQAYSCTGCAGGTLISGGSLKFPSGTVSTSLVPNSNTTYWLGWSVENDCWNGTTMTNTCGSGVTPDQKRITVTVSWVDEKNAVQAATLQGTIAALPPSNSSAVASGISGGSGGQPQVFYAPSANTGVVAVGVGDSNNTKRETLVPTTNSSGQVQFTAYTYNASNQLVRQEDFLTVSCNCALDSTQTQSRTASVAVWNNTSHTFIDQAGDMVTKDVGCVTNGKNANCVNNADELCTSCCADHHDPGTSATDSQGNKYCDPANGVLDHCYDPFRTASDYSNGKHNHYDINGNLANTGAYLESCRMKRINGFWRVYQDWNRIDLSAFPVAMLSNSTSKASYTSYVQSIIDTILDSSITNYHGQLFTLPTKPSVANITTSNPVSVTVGGQSQLTSRGVYVDYLSSALLTGVRAQKASSSNYLINVPFYEIEVNDRAPNCESTSNWNTTPTSTTGYGGWCSSATSNVIVGAGTTTKGNGLTAGLIQGVSATSDPVPVSFSMRRSNSGLMGLSEPVDAYSPSSANQSDIVKDTANVYVSVTGSGTTTHTLQVGLTGGTPVSSGTGTLTFTTSSGNGSCTGSLTSYSCSVPNSVGGSLSYSYSDTTQTCSGTYSYLSSDTSITMNISCTSLSTSHTLTVSITTGSTSSVASGTVTVTPTNQSSITCTGSSGTSYTCLVPNSVGGAISFQGVLATGSYCYGTGNYASGDTTASVTATCVTMRTLTVCVTPPIGYNLQSTATLTATPDGTCNSATGSGCSGGNKYSCSVPSGIGGSLAFTGIKKSGNTSSSCNGNSTYNSSDATISFSCQ